MGKNSLYDEIKATKVIKSLKDLKAAMKNPSPSPEEWKKDGEDHINIWEYGKTDLGKVLCHSSEIAFKHSIFGNFLSMDHFWHYIRSVERDDRIRFMNRASFKEFSRKLTYRHVDNFKAIIMDSNWQRINQTEVLKTAVKESTLPFDSYFVNKNTLIKIRPSYFKWFLAGFEEIRSALKENREPDFSFLLDKPNTGIYDFVLPSKQ